MGPLDGSGMHQWDSTDPLTRVRSWIPSGWVITDDPQLWCAPINLARLQRLAVPILLPALARIPTSGLRNMSAGLVSPLRSAS